MDPLIRIRKAQAADVDAVTAIYDAVTAREAAGLGCTGWQSAIYPNRATAEKALRNDELYVLERDGVILATARLNHIQDPAYAGVDWALKAPEERVFVIHTLAVDPAHAREGLGAAFMDYYEALAAELGCAALRLDTNEINRPARAFYAGRGYREAGVIPCTFNGLPGIRLVCLEKTVENRG